MMVIRLSNTTFRFTGRSGKSNHQTYNQAREEEENVRHAPIDRAMEIDNILHQVSIEDIIDGTKKGTVKVVNDGSYDKERQLEMASWIIATEQDIN